MDEMNVSRYINNIKIKFTVDIITPTFLGGADGNAEIRVAPFKNLLRRWWRIANGNLSVQELWNRESYLFGSIKTEGDNNTFGKSQVELIIDKIYKREKVNSAVNNIVSYDAIEKDPFTKKELTSLLYLGYGYISKKENNTKNYIKPDTQIDFILTIPKKEIDTFINLLSLIKIFGSIGGRSSKGFGSIDIIPKNEEPYATFKLKNLEKLQEAIPNLSQRVDCNTDSHNYPFCIGKDDVGMTCWNLKTDNKYKFTSWGPLMMMFQNIYKESIREFGIDNSFIEVKSIENSSEILGGSVQLAGHKEIEKIPSQLYIKISRTGDGGYRGMFIHFPYNIHPSLKTQNQVWQTVYKKLDALTISADNENRKLFKRLGEVRNNDK